MHPWQTLSRRAILNHSKWLTVEDHTVALSDGRVIADWPWLITPDYVNVLALTAEGHFICFRQTKYAVEGTTLAVVGGYLEPGEEPLRCAQRELLEEAGYAASAWTFLGRYAVDGNRGAGNAYGSLAMGARPVASVPSDDLEEQTLLLLSRVEIEAALRNHEFKVLGWAAIVALALFHLKD